MFCGHSKKVKERLFVCTVSEYYVHVQQLTVKHLICLLYSQSLIWMKEKKEKNFYSGQMHVFFTYKVYNQLRTDGKEFNLSEQFAGSCVWH